MNATGTRCAAGVIERVNEAGWGGGWRETEARKEADIVQGGRMYEGAVED